MKDVQSKIRMLEKFRDHPDRYLPVVDQAWHVFPRSTDDGPDREVNIGWDTGLLEKNRPYFMECWATCGITILTYFIPTAGIGDASQEDLLGMLTGAGLFRLKEPENPSVSVVRITDGQGNEFFAVNVAVGDEEHTFLEGGPVWPYGPLNEYNRKHGEAKK